VTAKVRLKICRENARIPAVRITDSGIAGVASAWICVTSAASSAPGAS
jgi:hypothetical protein